MFAEESLERSVYIKTCIAYHLSGKIVYYIYTTHSPNLKNKSMLPFYKSRKGILNSNFNPSHENKKAPQPPILSREYRNQEPHQQTKIED